MCHLTTTGSVELVIKETHLDRSLVKTSLHARAHTQGSEIGRQIIRNLLQLQTTNWIKLLTWRTLEHTHSEYRGHALAIVRVKEREKKSKKVHKPSLFDNILMQSHTIYAPDLTKQQAEAVTCKCSRTQRQLPLQKAATVTAPNVFACITQAAGSC